MTHIRSGNIPIPVIDPALGGGTLEYSIHRMEHAATMSVSGTGAYKNSENDINATDVYCYKIHLKNLSNYHLFDISTKLQWHVFDHPTQGPILPGDANLLNFVEPWPHAAEEIIAPAEESDCILLLLKDIGPQGEALSAINFTIRSMTPPAGFDVHLLNLNFLPGLKKQCFVFGDRIIFDEIKWEEETVD